MCRSTYLILILSAATLPAQGFPGMPPLPVMSAIDKDADGSLSPEEIADAAVSIMSLDNDGDGKLSEKELLPEGGLFGGRFNSFTGPRLIRMFPIMTALDADGDLELSLVECEEAGYSLITLDGDGNGILSNVELMPQMPNFRGGAAGERKPPSEIEFKDGTDSIPDRDTYKQLAYQGTNVLIDTHLSGLEYVKFVVADARGDAPQIYFINTKTHRAHVMFTRVAGLSFGGRGRGSNMMGVLVYRPLLNSPSDNLGLYTFEFEPNDTYPFEMIQVAHDLLEEYSPILAGNLAYHPLPAAIEQYEEEKALYEGAGLTVFLQADLYGDIAYLPLNQAEGFGRLRLMELDERPGMRDVVLYRSLPNEMPRVAGVITGVRQTPLSHVNLRAIQDKVPNAFINEAAEIEEIRDLIGSYVFYRVAADGYEIREASTSEVEAHFADLRPSDAFTPPRDLTVTEIRSLDDVDFDASKSVGVKAANIAAMRKMDLPEGLIPEGYAIPFHFYDAFMQHNGLFEKADAMRAGAAFAEDVDARVAALNSLRKEIEAAETPDWMMTALAELQTSFPEGTNIRCRSSTNNEDLPGFSGAGLYDSFTHRPEEGHLAQTVKQVYASLWNFRAFEEREFYRIDHSAAAMGVLVHPNYAGELANGVAVTDDIIYQTRHQSGRLYYLNTQVGEDMVTNPDSESIPEEILLHPSNFRNDTVVRSSNRVGAGERILSDAKLNELRKYLRTLHSEFRRLYGKKVRDQFAVDVEFKITAEGELAIKQARPWVY